MRHRRVAGGQSSVRWSSTSTLIVYEAVLSTGVVYAAVLEYIQHPHPCPVSSHHYRADRMALISALYTMHLCVSRRSFKRYEDVAYCITSMGTKPISRRRSSGRIPADALPFAKTISLVCGSLSVSVLLQYAVVPGSDSVIPPSDGVVRRQEQFQAGLRRAVGRRRTHTRFRGLHAISR